MSTPYRVGRAISPAGRNHTSARSGVARSASSERSHALGILGLRLRSFGSVGRGNACGCSLRLWRGHVPRPLDGGGVGIGRGDEPGTAVVERRAAFGYVWPTLADGNAVAAGLYQVAQITSIARAPCLTRPFLRMGAPGIEPGTSRV